MWLLRNYKFHPLCHSRLRGDDSVLHSATATLSLIFLILPANSFAMQTIIVSNINNQSHLGVALLLAGIACMVAEVFISTFGLLGIGGLIAFIIASFILLNTDVPGFGIPWLVIVVVIIVSAAYLWLILWLTIGSFRKKIVTGREALIGSEGDIIELYPTYMLVRVHGEIWNAESDSPLTIGEKVRVKKIRNLKLTVEPIAKRE